MSLYTAQQIRQAGRNLQLDDARAWALEAAYEAARKLDWTRQQLDEALVTASRRCAEARQTLAAGHLPNRLGVLQQAGADVDRLCAEYAFAAEMAGTTQKMAMAAGLLPKAEQPA